MLHVGAIFVKDSAEIGRLDWATPHKSHHTNHGIDQFQSTHWHREHGRQLGVRPGKLLKMIVWRGGTRSDRASHFRLSSADDAYEHLYILIVRSSLGPSPPNAGRYTVASRFRCRSCERGYIFPRAPEQFVASPLCLVGSVRWDARSDRVPPLQTIIFSSFPGRTPVCRPS